MFDVEDFRQFVVVQSETALRHLANQFPDDDYDADAISLRGNTDELRSGLQTELQTRLERAGIEILETRLTHPCHQHRDPLQLTDGREQALFSCDWTPVSSRRCAAGPRTTCAPPDDEDDSIDSEEPAASSRR